MSQVGEASSSSRVMDDSWLTHLQSAIPNLKVGVDGRCKGGRTFLVGLLGPSEVGPHENDGWFASDFALAHLLYGESVDEQCWLTCADLLEKVETGGPYLWGHPKEDRTVVFSKDDSKFYTVCSSEALISEFKNKLQEITASMEVEDKLLLLIFAHGEKADSSGILVGVDINGDDGILTAEEVNDLLQPLSGLNSVTLITSACYSGVWHDGTPIGTRVAASSRDEESLSFPESDSGNCRGGYFWGGVWYELSRLGIWVAGEEVPEDDTFQRWSDKVKQHVQDMFVFHPVPTISVPQEDIWDKHAKEVMCFKLDGKEASLSCEKVPPNPTPDSVSDIHFTGGSSMLKVLKALKEPLAERLPCLMQYFSTCNPGLPNASSNIQVSRLARLYNKGLASEAQLVELDLLLRYRVLEDRRAERVLSFLRIPRVCSIFNFKQWEHRGSEISPFLHVVSSVMPFGEPPKMTNRAYRYTKPVVYVAWTAFMAKVDVQWFKMNLRLYMDGRSSTTSHLRGLSKQSLLHERGHTVHD